MPTDRWSHLRVLLLTLATSTFLTGAAAAQIRIPADLPEWRQARA